LSGSSSSASESARRIPEAALCYAVISVDRTAREAFPRKCRHGTAGRG